MNFKGKYVMYRCLKSVLALSVVMFYGTVDARDYPTRPVRILTSPVGGSTDLIARLIAQSLTSSLGQQVIVDNRPTGIIPGEIVVKAPADGYTMLFHGSSLWMMQFLQKVPFDPVNDLVPVTLATSTPTIVVLNPTVPATTIKELIALAKAKPGSLNYASGAAGAASHLGAELFKYMASVNIVRVPYKGQGPAVLGLLGGEVQVGFASTGSVSGHIRAGKLRALAVTSARPSMVAPGLPTVSDAGLPGYKSVTDAGMFVPLKTPTQLVTFLNHEITKALSKADVKEILLREGTETVGSSPQEFAASIKAEMASLGKVIKAAGIRTE